MIRALLCWFNWHDTRLLASGTHGAIHCVRCQRELEVWPLVRPETAIQAAREHQRELAKREQLLREINARDQVAPVRRWPRKVG